MTEQPETDPEAKTLFTPPPALDTSAKTIIEKAPADGALKAWGAAIAAQSEASPNNTLKTPSAQLGHASALALLMPRAVVNETGKPATLMAPADYTVARQLGRGGMGVVYAARQESLSREVALKVLAPEVTSEHFEERFATEARLAGRLEHPNIVPVYELGRSAEGRLYLAMKLVRGEAFSAVLKRGDVPLRRLLEILMAIADALAFAHARNVIHRDLKPDNVMIGEFGEVQVMDWGLAIDLTEPRERGHAGTPAYMSPEQADGDPQRLGAWSDVYLLGAMLYEVLTGTPPHRGDGVLQVLLAAAKGEVQKPCDRAPARKIPGDLEALCLAALEKETEKRLPSAQAFKAGIATHLAHADALGLLDKARALIDAQDDDPDAEAERLRKAETFLEQARALWPESELARSLQVRARALQAELALDRGEGRKAAALAKELVPTDGVSQERIEQLTLAARRQVNRLRNQVIAGAILAVAMVLGHRGISELTEERAREHARRDARFALAARTGDAWRALAREEGREVVNESLAKLAATRDESGWDAAETDEPLVAAFATWQALGTGAERRAIELLPKAGWRQELEAVWAGDPLVAGDAWRVGATKAGVPDELERAAEACLVAGLARSLPAARLREQAGAIKDRLDQLGARAVLADARSGAPEAILGDLPVRVALEKGRPGAAGRKELDRVLVAHDAASGRELWRFPPPLDGTVSAPRSPLLLAPQPGPPASVLVAWGTDVLALDPLTGVVRSRARILDEVAALLPAPGGRVLAVQRATAGHARSRLVPCEPGKVLAPVIPGASVTALSFEASSARVWVGEPRSEKPATTDLEAALARLSDARKIDPTNAAWDLEEAKLLELAGRHDDARAALERAGRGDLSAWELAVAAQWASDHALADAGEKLLERAVVRAAALGHDADASPALLGNAGFAARRAAESAARKGDTESMLRELALARELATVVEGDRTLVPLEKDWLRAHQREPELEALRPYEHPARVAGGTLSMPEGLVELFDVGVGMTVVAPIVLVAACLALWRRSRPTQVRDLRVLGFRTRSARALAFLANPVLRFTHTFLAYASRTERALLAAGALVAFLAASYLALVTTTIAKVAAIPVEAATGYLGHPSAAEHFRHANEHAPAVKRVLVEGALMRGDEERARALLEELLERDPHDPFALDVKGVLTEPTSRDQALALYDEAAKAAGDAGAPGRWNAARLRGVAREKRPALPPGYAAFSRAPDGPMRQLVSLEDHRIAIDVGALGPEYAHAVLASLVGGGPRLYAFAETAGSLAGGLEWAVRALARVLLVAALLHLPFATRSSLPVDAKRGELVARWVDLGLPGTFDLARGRVARGASVLGFAAFLALLALAGLRGGIIESLATTLPPLATTFAPEAHSLLFRPAWLATMGHAALLGLAVVYVTHWIAPAFRKRTA